MNFLTLPKEVKELNRQLIDHFGIDTDTSLAIWRVSWSKDQYEHRLSEYTPGGIKLLVPLVQHLPKYQYINPPCWILERLVLVPEINKEELPKEKKSYECMYAFEEVTPHPPSFEACKFIVDTVYAALGKSSMRKYIDEDAEYPIERREQRINKLQEELFGDESGLLGRTITGEAVIVPQSYQGDKK